MVEESARSARRQRAADGPALVRGVAHVEEDLPALDQVDEIGDGLAFERTTQVGGGEGALGQRAGEGSALGRPLVERDEDSRGIPWLTLAEPGYGDVGQFLDGDDVVDSGSVGRHGQGQRAGGGRLDRRDLVGALEGRGVDESAGEGGTRRRLLERRGAGTARGRGSGGRVASAPCREYRKTNEGGSQKARLRAHRAPPHGLSNTAWHLHPTAVRRSGRQVCRGAGHEARVPGMLATI